MAGSDYSAVSISLTFLPGETVKTLAVPIMGDTQVEPDETVIRVQDAQPVVETHLNASGGALRRQKLWDEKKQTPDQ